MNKKTAHNASPTLDAAPNADVERPVGNIGEDALTTVAAAKPVSRTRLTMRRLLASPRFWIGGSILVLMVLFAAFGNVINIYGPNDQDAYALNQPPSGEHWFGTDTDGYDIYAQVVVGLRKSIIIGLAAGIIGTFIAAIMGSLAGYLGGKVEMVINWLINFMLVLPSFFVLLLFAPALKGLSWVAIIVIVAAFAWMITAQVVKAQTKSLRDAEFVQAARYMGLGTPTILARHIIPNIASLLIVDATLGVVGAVLSETSLSFFGLGVQSPDISIGTLLSAGTSGAVTRPWVFLFPAAALVLLLTAVSVVADALRDAIDPTSGVNRG